MTIDGGEGGTGVDTQNAWLARGLDPTLKSVRAANYLRTLRRDLTKVAEACGVVYGYRPEWGLPSPADQAEITPTQPARTEVPGPGAACMPRLGHCRSGRKPRSRNGLMTVRHLDD
ncbi:hypothetical protein [Micromonospora ureilytica]|uniref:hypothetical protein n=1 Tax=Micromonospora ureilytica TaxID=709868 RepID=UPI0040390396